MKTQIIRQLKKAAIVAFIIFGVALVQTCDSRDRHSPNYIPDGTMPPPRQTQAEIDRINDLGGHDADTDIQWSYKK